MNNPTHPPTPHNFEAKTAGGGGFYTVYPNRRGKARQDENRGALRIGMVEKNEATEEAGTGGYLAAVTYEHDGTVWYYVWDGCWKGPHWGLSEEITPMEEA